MRPPWSYVQARLQARHGERLHEGDWRTLEAARSLEQFLDRSRATSLRRFTERLNAGMPSHAIERVLRAGWRKYVAEVAGLGRAEIGGRPCVDRLFPDLPAIDALLRGEAPSWVRQDPAFARCSLKRARGRPQFENRRSMFIAAGAEARADGGQALVRALALALAERRRRAPRRSPHWLKRVEAHVARLDRAGPKDTSAPYRRELGANNNPHVPAARRNANSPCSAISRWWRSISSGCAAASCAGALFAAGEGGRMSLRPIAAQWFELVTVHKELARVMECLSRTGAVELEARSRATDRLLFPGVEDELKAHRELARHYQNYWPAPAADGRRPAELSETLKSARARLAEWAATADPIITVSERMAHATADLEQLRAALQSTANSWPGLASARGRRAETAGAPAGAAGRHVAARNPGAGAVQAVADAGRQLRAGRRPRRPISPRSRRNLRG